MAELYRKVVDDEGNEELVQVDLNEVELPDDTFYNDPRYKEVADRDYSRRQRVKELEEQLQAQEAQTSTEDDSEDQDPVDSGLSEEEFERMWQQREEDFELRLLERLQNREKEAQEKSNRIANIIKKNNLPDDVRSVLESVDDPESVGETLARAGMKLGTNKSGGEQQDTLSERLANINKNLGLED